MMYLRVAKAHLFNFTVIVIIIFTSLFFYVDS